MIESPVVQVRGRAKNALQDYLANKLYIPKVYLDTDWAGMPVDVLAVDRAGVGDVHAVRMMFLEPDTPITTAFLLINAKMNEEVSELYNLRCHFRYLAIWSDDRQNARFDPRELVAPKLFAEDGVGRIGILYVDLSQDEPTVSVIAKPERFRSSKELIDLADRYVAEHTANWEIRE
jgi:hypothetical protein